MSGSISGSAGGCVIPGDGADCGKGEGRWGADEIELYIYDNRLVIRGRYDDKNLFLTLSHRQARDVELAIREMGSLLVQED
jgi:hypothetical protein